jgi:copper resistance protein D
LLRMVIFRAARFPLRSGNFEMSTDLLGLFGLIAVVLRAAILCFQTIAVGGIIFLLVVAGALRFRQEPWLHRATQLIRWSVLALAIAQASFVISNTLVLTFSADVPVGEALGANYVIAGVLAVAAGLVVFFRLTPPRGRVTPLSLIPAAAMIASSVMTSHSASRIDSRFVLSAFTVIHYVATASWIGGLPYLLFVTKHAADFDLVAHITHRYSRLAQISVTLLFAAGLGLSLWYVGAWNAIYGTAYGLMLSTKLIFFGCLSLLGAANYFLVRTIRERPKDRNGIISLTRFAEVEIGIGLTVILAAASLTSQPPGVDLTQDRVTLHDIARRYAPRMPQLSSPDLKQISGSTKELRRRAEAEGRKVASAFVPGADPLSTNSSADIAWSEYNHSWAGVFVLLTGLLALLSRSKYFGWARIWPLIFLGLALFLFLRSDPENWPLGPNGFWESFTSSDVLQHRVAVILVIMFAIFQWRVETNRLQSQFAALVFPAVCALGGITLLTHTHPLSNVKEQVLIELSHTPLAILAVIAGWSRWLELRLPEPVGARKCLAWVWPVCFILIGLILIDYHETSIV